MPYPVGSASPSTVSHGRCRSGPCSHREHHRPSTSARCLSIPPRVIDDAPTVAFRPAASSPRDTDRVAGRLGREAAI